MFDFGAPKFFVPKNQFVRNFHHFDHFQNRSRFFFVPKNQFVRNFDHFPFAEQIWWGRKIHFQI